MELFEGFIFDVYSLEETIYIWIKGNYEIKLFTDTFYPSIYISGEPRYENSFLKRLFDLKAIYGKPERVTKISFYENKPRNVLKIVLTKPSVLRRIYKNLFAFYEKLEIFHSDLEITNAYMLEMDIFPIANVKVIHEKGRIQSIQCLSDLKSCDYKIPDFSKLQISFKNNHRIGYSRSNPIVFSNEEDFYAEVFEDTAKKLLGRINEILKDLDPDIILSAYGDQAIFLFYSHFPKEQKFDSYSIGIRMQFREKS